MIVMRKPVGWAVPWQALLLSVWWLERLPEWACCANVPASHAAGVASRSAATAAAADSALYPRPGAIRRGASPCCSIARASTRRAGCSAARAAPAACWPTGSAQAAAVEPPAGATWVRRCAASAPGLVAAEHMPVARSAGAGTQTGLLACAAGAAPSAAGPLAACIAGLAAPVAVYSGLQGAAAATAGSRRSTSAGAAHTGRTLGSRYLLQQPRQRKGWCCLRCQLSHANCTP